MSGIPSNTSSIFSGPTTPTKPKPSLLGLSPTKKEVIATTATKVQSTKLTTPVKPKSNGG